jgi:hypothetical protein
MIKVVCINTRGITSLVEGKEYEATSLYNEQIWEKGHYVDGKRRRIKIKNLKSYYIDRFRAADGSDLKKIPPFEDKIMSYNNNTFEKTVDYTGQYVKAKYDYYKLKKDEFYLVEKDFGTMSNGERHFKIKGLPYRKSYYNFYPVSLTEQRSLKLQTINGDDIKTGLSTRKFLLYNDRKKIEILFEVLGVTLKRLSGTEDLHGVSLAKQMVKAGRIYDIEEQDAIEFLNRSIVESIKNCGLDI